MIQRFSNGPMHRADVCNVSAIFVDKLGDRDIILEFYEASSHRCSRNAEDCSVVPLLVADDSVLNLNLESPVRSVFNVSDVGKVDDVAGVILDADDA